MRSPPSSWARLDGKVPDFIVEGRSPGSNGLRAEEAYEVLDGVAVIPVFGIIDKRVNVLMDYSGGTSTQILKHNIQTALNDDQVRGIVLQVDSPGGGVDGVKELADFIFENRRKKPVIAYADGMAASAAYWIASAASEIVASETTMVGSIGESLTHSDRSGRDAQAGVVRTEVFSGRFKRVATDSRPLSQEGASYLQELVDRYYEIFVTAIVLQRGMSAEQVAGTEAREFLARQALEAKLVDRVGTLENALQLARGEIPPRRPAAGEEKPMARTFESLVNESRASGLTRTAALLAAAKQYPAEHVEFIERANAMRPAGSAPQGSSRSKLPFSSCARRDLRRRRHSVRWQSAIPIFTRRILIESMAGVVSRFQHGSKRGRGSAPAGASGHGSARPPSAGIKHSPARGSTHRGRSSHGSMPADCPALFERRAENEPSGFQPASRERTAGESEIAVDHSL